MSKETIDNLANKATAGSTTALLAVAFFAWQNLSDIKTQLATHIEQTNRLIHKLEERIDNLERRFGAMPGRHD